MGGREFGSEVCEETLRGLGVFGAVEEIVDLLLRSGRCSREGDPACLMDAPELRQREEERERV